MSETRNISTFVRVRPLSALETERNEREIVSLKDQQATTIGVLDPALLSMPNMTSSFKDKSEKCFQFDEIVWLDSTQNNVYLKCARSLINASLDGFNCSLFAYGQTGSGKTHTMLGHVNGGESSNEGIIPRLCTEMMQIVDTIRQDPRKSHEIKVFVTYYEIYNERVHDLLVDSNTSTTTAAAGLRVREHPVEGAYVEGLNKVEVNSYDGIKVLLKGGDKRRAMGSTLQNNVSSRSHAVFTLHIQQDLFDSSSTAVDQRIQRKSKINLIDLAGSERASLSGASGTRLREANNINKSLSTLSEVITALSERPTPRGATPVMGATPRSVTPVNATPRSATTPRDRDALESSSGETLSISSPATSTSADSSIQRQNASSAFVPYRNSLLTWLLKDSLGGSSICTILATISPAESAFSETICTLRFLERAKRVTFHSIQNESRLLLSPPSQQQTAKLQQRINTLERQVEKLQAELLAAQSNQCASPNSDVAVLSPSLKVPGDISLQSVHHELAGVKDQLSVNQIELECALETQLQQTEELQQLRHLCATLDSKLEASMTAEVELMRENRELNEYFSEHLCQMEQQLESLEVASARDAVAGVIDWLCDRCEIEVLTETHHTLQSDFQEINSELFNEYEEHEAIKRAYEKELQRAEADRISKEEFCNRLQSVTIEMLNGIERKRGAQFLQLSKQVNDLSRQCNTLQNQLTSERTTWTECQCALREELHRAVRSMASIATTSFAHEDDAEGSQENIVEELQAEIVVLNLLLFELKAEKLQQQASVGDSDSASTAPADNSPTKVPSEISPIKSLGNGNMGGGGASALSSPFPPPHHQCDMLERSCLGLSSPSGVVNLNVSDSSPFRDGSRDNARIDKCLKSLVYYTDVVHRLVSKYENEHGSTEESSPLSRVNASGGNNNPPKQESLQALVANCKQAIDSLGDDVRRSLFVERARMESMIPLRISTPGAAVTAGGGEGGLASASAAVAALASHEQTNGGRVSAFSTAQNTPQTSPRRIQFAVGTTNNNNSVSPRPPRKILEQHSQQAPLSAVACSPVVSTMSTSTFSPNPSSFSHRFDPGPASISKALAMTKLSLAQHYADYEDLQNDYRALEKCVCDYKLRIASLLEELEDRDYQLAVLQQQYQQDR